MTHDFELPSTGDKTFRLENVRGSPAVVYFYPRDNTPGCTTEAVDFRDLYNDFRALGATVVGISRDSLRSHDNFKAKFSLPFELLSDPNEKVCGQYGVMKLKTMYGKTVRGVERSTFVFDKTGALVKEWRGVKVPGHVREVLDFLKTLV